MNVWIIFSIFCFLVLVICFIYLLKKGGDILHNLEYTAWESLSDALQSENFHKISEIRFNKTIYCKTKNDYIPNVIVSVDTVGERLAVSYISEEIKNEKNVITGYKLASDYFNFSEITGGQILTGGQSVPFNRFGRRDGIERVWYGTDVRHIVCDRAFHAIYDFSQQYR